MRSTMHKQLIKSVLKVTTPAIALLLSISTFKRGYLVNTRDSTTLKIAFKTSVPIEELDSKSINEGSDYIALELLMSTLVEYNNQGEIIGGLAERFYWNENELIFEFRDASFSSGSPVTPEDAVATFKRLMILNTNSHGELANLLCTTERPKKLNDTCDGIRADGKRLILTAKKRTPFLLPLLTSIDYGILNKNSIDRDSLKILSLEDTSGPYRLKKVDGKIYFYANKNHWHYNLKMPQRIEFISFDYDTNSSNSAENLFIEGVVDFVPTTSELRLNNVENIRKRANREFRTHTTNPMALAFAQYTMKGLALPVETRRHIFACMQRAVKKHLVNDPSGRYATLQILPPSSEGNLSLDQTRLIESEIENRSQPCDALGIRIAVPQFLLEFYKRVLDSEINNFKLIGYPKATLFGERNDKDVPELTIVGVDVASIEDVNFISYAVKSGFLVPPRKQTPADWLKNYFDTPEKSDRMDLLQKMHFNTVWEDPRIIPFSIRPFVSVIDSKWSTDFSKLFPNDPCWKIRLK